MTIAHLEAKKHIIRHIIISEGCIGLIMTSASTNFNTGCLVLLWAKRPFETLFQSTSGRLPDRGRKKREMIDERKKAKQPPPAPTVSAVGPCITMIQISRTPRHWKFIQHHRTTPSTTSKTIETGKTMETLIMIYV